ncbi:hypothetical protein M569_11040 [Genlisea aurea]|uniref:Inositol polyphosphate-related phosphatase domain-containing protein n=1 Tax=Genlisea aurea TaxID=192259 RepID=S8C9Z5_9LAMI|nr:hypothetical protein M569_11040 [Genlisea aurea]
MKLSWTKSLVKKWLNIRSKAEDFQADVDNDDDDDDLVADASPPPPPQDVDEEWNSSSCTINMKSNSEKFVGRKAQRFRIEPDSPSSSHFTDTHNFKVFVGTWNVAGKSPPPYLNLEDWLHNSSPADIYVLG